MIFDVVQPNATGGVWEKMEKNEHAHTHGLRGRNFWKNNDFAPMQFNSFDWGVNFILKKFV